MPLSSSFAPALPADWPPAAPRTLCTDCGISRSSEPQRCGRACQFIHPDYARLESSVHGRARDTNRADELHFGPFRRMLRAALAQPTAGAQWTGITTRLAERLLETGAVDAVLTMAPDPEDRWRPVPVLVTKAADMASCRGMRMGYAPLLALLEPARAAGHKRLAVIGIPCQVYALRALEAELGFERLYVIGTPCSDNTTTARFHEFLRLLSDRPETITYLEFLPDYHVEVRYADGSQRRMPQWLRPIVGWLMPKVGPRGLEFARARVEMKATETIIHLRREQPAKMKNMVPRHVWELVQPYGLQRTPEERPAAPNPNS